MMAPEVMMGPGLDGEDPHSVYSIRDTSLRPSVTLSNMSEAKGRSSNLANVPGNSHIADSFVPPEHENMQEDFSSTSPHSNSQSNRKSRAQPGVKPFPCPVCGKRFSQKGNMKMHQRVHTGEKPFVCPTCGKRFSQKGNMQTHTRIHSGVKPFECVECKQAFRQKSKLLAHMKRHQQNGGSSKSSSRSSAPQNGNQRAMAVQLQQLIQLTKLNPSMINKPLTMPLIPGMTPAATSPMTSGVEVAGPILAAKEIHSPGVKPHSSSSPYQNSSGAKRMPTPAPLPSSLSLLPNTILSNTNAGWSDNPSPFSHSQFINSTLDTRPSNPNVFGTAGHVGTNSRESLSISSQHNAGGLGSILGLCESDGIHNMSNSTATESIGVRVEQHDLPHPNSETKLDGLSGVKLGLSSHKEDYHTLDDDQDQIDSHNALKHLRIRGSNNGIGVVMPNSRQD
mmetsp:Transcript_16719/g.23392  ORF Transcript_16719/g.23392 Transcript_16719/m.23392 type:complete len:450 (+) Transcript_16719:353-1702(+)